MNYLSLIRSIERINHQSISTAARAVNHVLTSRNWLIGACIFEFEQKGEDRAAYGSELLSNAAADLKSRGVVGLSLSNLKNFRQFAVAYSGVAIGQTLSAQFGRLMDFDEVQDEDGIIGQALSGQLGRRMNPDESSGKDSVLDPRGLKFPSLAERGRQRFKWQTEEYYVRLFRVFTFSHLLELSRSDDPLKRAFYELEGMKSCWSLRELKRQINGMLFERAGLSRNKDAVMALAQEGELTEAPATIFRDPYLLEFLRLEEHSFYSESDLEMALIEHLKEFLLELGRDFCFVARQFRISVGGRHHFIDLLFFHRALRCLIAVDVKLGEFRHEYAGQMNFYLNYLREEVAHTDENPPVGLILCADKDVEEVHYATAGLDHHLFVSRYQIQLPSEERLLQWLREEQRRQSAD